MTPPRLLNKSELRPDLKRIPTSGPPPEELGAGKTLRSGGTGMQLEEITLSFAWVYLPCDFLFCRDERNPKSKVSLPQPHPAQDKILWAELTASG